MDYRPDLQGLRAIAVVLVILCHAGMPGFGGGFVAVDVFFVLSGYLISGLLITEFSRTGQIRFIKFYMRRFQRLAPALLTMLVVVSLVTYVVIAPSDQVSHYITGATAAMWLSNIHFVVGNLDYFSTASSENIYLHTWSLSVEEQFYLVWPWLILLAMQRGKSVLGLTRTVMLTRLFSLIFLLSFLLCLYLTYNNAIAAYFLTTSRAWQFAVGGLVFLFLNQAGSLGHKLVPDPEREAGAVFAISGWLGLACLAASTVWISDLSHYPGVWALLPTLGTALILISGSIRHRYGISGILSTRVLVFIGNVSYGWYLWHWPILALSKTLNPEMSPGYTAAALVASFFLACLSYQLIESPIRRSHYLLSRPRIFGSVAGLAMLVVVVFQISLLDRGQSKIGSPVLEELYAARYDLPAIYSMGCDDWTSSSEVNRCEFGSEGAMGEIMLIGDSMLAQWFSAFASIVEQGDWRLTVVTKSACPMVDQAYFYAKIGKRFKNCELWREQLLAEVIRSQPDIVVMGSSPGYPFSPAEWEDGTSRVLEEISDHVGKIHILRSTPVLPFDALNCAKNQAWQKSILSVLSATDCSISVEKVDGEQVYIALEAAARRYSNVDVVDVNNAVCPGGSCTATDRGTIVFRDVQHLTDSFVRKIAPVFLRRTELSSYSSQVSNDR